MSLNRASAVAAITKSTVTNSLNQRGLGVSDREDKLLDEITRLQQIVRDLRDALREANERYERELQKSDRKIA